MAAAAAARAAGGWRQHVREALERREGRARRLCVLLERHEKLQLRLETLLGGAGAEARCQLEVVELRREREELHQQLAVVTEILERTEAEAREQRARTQRLVRDLGALQHQHQELQGQVWGLCQEAEGLRGELDQAQRLLREAQQERLRLENRWMREKALEAERLNWANEREERHQRKVSCLMAELKRGGAGGVHIPRTGSQMAVSEISCSASWEEVEMAAVMRQVQATPRSRPSSAGEDD